VLRGYAGSLLPGLDVEEFVLLLPERREAWVAADGSTRVRVRIGEPRFLDEAIEEAFAAGGLGAVIGVGETIDETYGPAPDRIDLSDWPTEPDELEDWMRSEAAASDPAGAVRAHRVLDVAAELLTETGARPTLRAAVLRVLARAEGLEVVEGEEGVAVEVGITYRDETGVWRRSIGFDGEGSLVRSRLVDVDGLARIGIPPGTAVEDARYSPTVIVTAFP
jgi:hypothetical protein